MTVIKMDEPRVVDVPDEWLPVYGISRSTSTAMLELKAVINPLVHAVVQLQERVAALEAQTVGKESE